MEVSSLGYNRILGSFPRRSREKLKFSSKKKLIRVSGDKVSEIKTLIKEVASLKRHISETSTITTEEKKEDGYIPNDWGIQFGGHHKGK